MLVLWQVYQELTSSDTAAQAEIDGLVAQIEETMTDEQLTTVSAMDLTQQDVFTLLQAQTLTTGFTQRSSIGVNVTQTNTGFASSGGGGGVPPDGGMAGGAPPDGGMGDDLGGMGGPMPDNSASQSQNTGEDLDISISVKVPTALVGALVQYLAQRADS